MSAPSLGCSFSLALLCRVRALGGGKDNKGQGLPRAGTDRESETDVDYEKHKQDSLNKQRKGSGHWKPELASDSEEAVKADRAGHDGDVASLQEKTKRVAEESSKAGTSVRDGM